MKSIGRIALAMDNNVQSSQLITVGRRALNAFVREEDVHEAMDIIARSQSEPDSFDRNMLHYAISIVGNTEFVGYTEYIVSRKAIPLLLSIMSSDIADATFVASTIHALGRLLTTSDTIAMFQSENGMQRLEDVVNSTQYSEMIMYRICDTVQVMLNTKHEVPCSELMRSITTVFKAHGEATMWMPRYYAMLNDILGDYHFVALLIAAGLMDGIRSQLQHNKERSEDIMSCVAFITHLQSKQPKTTKDVIHSCGQDIVDLIEMHAANANTLKALYDTIHPSIFNDPHAVTSFKPYGLEDVLHKVLELDDNHETHHLLSVLKIQEELMSDLNSIKTIALQLTQTPKDADLRKQLQVKVQFVMSHIDRASLIKPVHQSFVHLYKTKHGAELVADSGIIQLAIQHMSENPYANDCTIYAAKIIGALATKCPAKCKKILLSGVSTIANALNQLHADPDIASALTQTVNILCGLNSKFIQGFIDAGTVQDVLDIVNMFNSGDCLLDLLILIACTELLIKFAESDNSVCDSIKEKGAMKGITLAMTNHPDSSKLKTAGRTAIKLFVQEDDLSQAMDIIAQSRGDHNINVLQHAISMVSNMELNAANIEKILLEREGLTEKSGIIPHLLSIIDEHLRSDEANIEGLFTTVHALSRLLIAPDAIATYVWQEHDGINIFETIVHNVSHSELVMIAVCEAIRNIVNTADGADIIKEESDLLPLITKNVLKANGDYAQCIRKYYDILTNPDSEMLDITSGEFVNALMENGLIEGINNHLQQNENEPDQVIAAIRFISFLLSKQPKYTNDIITNCGQSVVNAVNCCGTNDTEPHSLGLNDVLRKLVLCVPDFILLFSNKCSSDMMGKIMHETDAKAVDDEDGNQSQQSMLLMLAKHNMFFESPNKVPEYFNILMAPQHQYLNDPSFVRLLIEYGLIKGIKHHLKQRKDKREDVILSAEFITHLLQKQPQFTKTIVDSFGRAIIHLLKQYSTDSDVLHSLCETIHTAIGTDPDTISTFKQNGLESVLKAANDETNDLATVLKQHDEIITQLSSINTIALQLMDNPSDIEELKAQFHSVITHIRSATNTPIKRNNRLILISEFDQLESYLNATNLGMLFWAKGVIRQRMNVAQDPRLKQIAITVHNVGKGSICIDYTLETYDIQLLDLAEKNIHSADKNITFLDDDTANNPQQPNEEATPHQFVASLVKPIHQSFVNLYKTKQGAELAVDAGTIQFVLQQVSDNPRTNECCVYAAKMIGALATECPAKTAKILEGDHGNGSGVSIIANTLNKLHSDPDTSAALIKVIHILCGNAELIHGLIEADAVQSVLNVLSMFNSGSSLMQLLLLIACMELLIKFSRLDGRVSGLIRRNGAMKSIGCIALAMDNNVESSQLIAVGRRAL
eukprot:10881_1